MQLRFFLVLAALSAAELACGGSGSGRPIAWRASAAAATVAGEPVQVVLSAIDPTRGAPVPFVGAVRFSSSDARAEVPATAAFSPADAGSKTFTFILKTAGAQKIVVQDATGAQELATVPIDVTPAAGSALELLIGQSVSACLPVSFSVRVMDPFGNVATGYRGTVRFSSSNPNATVPVEYTFNGDDAGFHVFTLNANAAGPQTLDVADAATGLRASGSTFAGGWCSVGPALGSIRALALDPRSPLTLVAGTPIGLYRSTDGGASWSRPGPGPASASFSFAIAVDGASRWYAGLFGGLYFSSDAGLTWLAADSSLTPGGEGNSIALDPAHPGTAYAGTGPGINGLGVLKSTNAGATWGPVNSGLPRSDVGVTAVAVDAAAGVAYAAFGASGVYRTADGGSSWSACSTTAAGASVATLAVGSPSEIYAGLQPSLLQPPHGLYRSRDGCATWSPADSGQLGPVTMVTIDSRPPSTVYVGTGLSMARSTDSGATWTFLAPRRVNAVALAPDPNTLFVGTDDIGVLKSSDGGATFVSAGKGMASAFVRSVAVDPVNAGRVYAGLRGAFVAVSVDRGATWTPNVLTDGGDVEALIIDPQNPSTMYASSLGVSKSTDAGKTWSPMNAGLSGKVVRTLAIDPAIPSTVYGGTQSDGVVKTVDGASTWNSTGLTSSWVFSIAVDPRASAVYARTSLGLFKSVNGGASWSQSAAGIVKPDPNPHPVLVSADSTVYVGSRSGTVRSRDGGATWTVLDTLPLGAFVLSLAGDPQQASVLYAGVIDGVYRSSDAGQTWSQVSEGLPPAAQIFSLAIDPFDTTTLYAGTAGASVFKTTTRGQ